MGARTNPELPIAATVGANLRTLRQLRGISLNDLDQRTGRAGHRINWNALNEIERGINRYGGPRAVTVDQLVVLAAVFRVSPLDFLRPDLDPTTLPTRSATTRRPQNTPKTGHKRA